MTYAEWKMSAVEADRALLFMSGAAVAFGIMGMFEAIRTNPLYPCVYCGHAEEAHHEGECLPDEKDQWT